MVDQQPQQQDQQFSFANSFVNPSIIYEELPLAEDKVNMLKDLKSSEELEIEKINSEKKSLLKHKSK